MARLTARHPGSYTFACAGLTGATPELLVRRYHLTPGDIGEADTLQKFLDELAAIAPVYFVLGNHDYYRSSIAAVRGAMERLASSSAGEGSPATALTLTGGTGATAGVVTLLRMIDAPIGTAK